MMQPSTQSELVQTAEILFQMLEKFEETYPDQWAILNEQIYSIAEMNLSDLSNLLQVFSEVAK